jgi:hypothetical protein
VRDRFFAIGARVDKFCGANPEYPFSDSWTCSPLDHFLVLELLGLGQHPQGIGAEIMSFQEMKSRKITILAIGMFPKAFVR